MSFFDVYGPFPIATGPNGVRRGQAALWEAANHKAHGEVSAAIGCYVYCHQWGEKLRPWYIGMTRSKKGFAGEAFQPHKIGIYNECLRDFSGRPMLFILPLLLTDGEFSRAYKSAKREISWLEKTLMGFAFRKNPDISNVRDMKFLREVEVLGLMGKRQGRPHAEAKAIKQALG